MHRCCEEAKYSLVVHSMFIDLSLKDTFQKTNDVPFSTSHGNCDNAVDVMLSTNTRAASGDFKHSVSLVALLSWPGRGAHR